MFFLIWERHRVPHMKRGKEYRIPHVKEVESLAPIPYVFFGAEKKVLKKKFSNFFVRHVATSGSKNMGREIFIFLPFVCVRKW